MDAELFQVSLLSAPLTTFIVMRSKRYVHAIVRAEYRPWGREPQVKTLCEDAMLWQLTRDNSQNAVNYHRPLRLWRRMRNAARRVLGFLGLL